jgi:hypothetical protein
MLSLLQSGTGVLAKGSAVIDSIGRRTMVRVYACKLVAFPCFDIQASVI